MTSCAFLGLGVMGGPMARHLGNTFPGFGVWNRTASRVVEWWGAGGKGDAYLDPDSAAVRAEVLLMCLGDDPDVEEVFGVFEPELRPGMLIIDHTTGSPGLARRLAARARAKGCEFLDAPVSGGQAGAEAGRLTVMCGGTPEAFARAEPIMRAYSASMTLIGDSGSGQLAKSVNQICIAGVVQGLAEALHFARAAGLEEEKVIAAISKGAAQSWQMENRWKTMTAGKFDFGFAVDWMRKDLRIALDTARTSGAALPLTALVDQFYAELQAQGHGRSDTSSLIARLNREP